MGKQIQGMQGTQPPMSAVPALAEAMRGPLGQQFWRLGPAKGLKPLLTEQIQPPQVQLYCMHAANQRLGQARLESYLRRLLGTLQSL